MITGQPSRFPTDREKIIFACSYLKDEAKAWVTPSARKIPEDQPPFMKDYDLFVKELQKVFGDPDEKGTAARQLNDIRQKGAAKTYFTEIRRLGAILGESDSTLIFYAKYGLKDSVKEQLSMIDIPETLDSFILAATRIDDRNYERRLERNREHGKRTTHKAGPSGS